MSTEQPVNRYEQPLRDLLVHLDYDLHKAIACNEDGEEDEYPELAEKFARAVDGPRSVDIAGTQVPIEDIAKSIVRWPEGTEIEVGGYPWVLHDEAVFEGDRADIQAETYTGNSMLTVVLRVESVTVR